MTTQSAHLIKLKSLNKELRSKVLNTYPELQDSIKEDAVEQLADIVIHEYGSVSYPATLSVESQVSQALSNESSHAPEIAWDISLEEFQIVLDKLKALSQLPPGSPPDETALYLEQQLSDIFGFTVCSRLKSLTLPTMSGTIYADQHLPLNNERATTSGRIREAGVRRYRSAFGYPHTDVVNSNVATYVLGLPLQNLPEWSQESHDLRGAYKNIKIVVINPADARAVIAVVGDIAPTLDTLFQCTGSPALIRDGLFWSPKANGKCILYLVDDPKNEVPLGIIPLHHPTLS